VVRTNSTRGIACAEPWPFGPAPLTPQPERKLAPQDAAKLAEAMRALAAEPPDVALGHMGLRFPPVEEFVERFRGLLARRTVLDFDSEVAGLDRVEQAVAFLALLELRKTGEVALDQAAPFAPIRIKKEAAPMEAEWTVRSA
jgi:chromatin segregation and condensation protein Rec8/ScpA/Scc1 (kleisin family)